MAEDAPGYSRWIRPAGFVVPSAYEDNTTNRKIDVNDGVTMPAVMQKTGWAGGAQVSYWDFGAGKRGAAPAYGLADCGNGIVPRDHPIIVDSVPGDSDYSPFRALAYACVTSKYNGEVLPSLDAFNDAIDLGLIIDPTGMPAATWVDQPITTPNVARALAAGNKNPVPAYYRNTQVVYHSLAAQESPPKYDPAMGVQTNNVYEIVKPGSMTPVRVVFSQPYYLADGSINAAYSPAWLQVTVTLKAQTGADMAAVNAAYDAVLANITKESDLVTVGMMNMLTVTNPAVTSAVATTNRVNRPFVAHPEEAVP